MEWLKYAPISGFKLGRMFSLFSKCSPGLQFHKHSRKSFWLHSAVRKRCSLQSEMTGEVPENKPMERAIRQKLVETLNPVHLDIINESYMHNVPPGSETHFKVVVVSDKFDNLPLIKAKTPTQWKEGTQVSPSPACRGGFGK
ncbi:bolA-like protein DDB_G0274169 isoform X2 [Cryptotermes secundus]|uniref:bolA-like protein DDB_G0274169 isoform X2 n=1 Tax=Cryptotermes secundus TaxID=105785 RepID=UPI000CD7B932|nr:bolA-like protein DDB_G0274169 isoform X2 [Cryptotermes secundus]